MTDAISINLICCTRKLQCGYNRACTIMDLLVQDGFITEPDAIGNRHFRDAVGGPSGPR